MCIHICKYVCGCSPTCPSLQVGIRFTMSAAQRLRMNKLRGIYFHTTSILYPTLEMCKGC